MQDFNSGRLEDESVSNPMSYDKDGIHNNSYQISKMAVGEVNFDSNNYRPIIAKHQYLE